MDATEVEQLKQQMENMMKVLYKEESCHQKAKANLVSAGTRKMTSPTLKPLQPTHGPKIGI